MSNTKEVQSKPRLHVSLLTCYLEYGSHLARLHRRRRRRRRRRRAYAPTSNTASHDNHEKINSWVSFCFPYIGCLWGSAWRSFRPPELRCFHPLRIVLWHCAWAPIINVAIYCRKITGILFRQFFCRTSGLSQTLLVTFRIQSITPNLEHCCQINESSVPRLNTP